MISNATLQLQLSKKQRHLLWRADRKEVGFLA